MTFTERQEAWLLRRGIREPLAGLPRERQLELLGRIQRGLEARLRLRQLGLENTLSEREMQDELDRATGVLPDEAPVVEFGDTEEERLAREFAAVLDASVAPVEQVTTRAFSAEDPDALTDSERELADAFDRLVGA